MSHDRNTEFKILNPLLQSISNDIVLRMECGCVFVCVCVSILFINNCVKLHLWGGPLYSADRYRVFYTQYEMTLFPF